MSDVVNPHEAPPLPGEAEAAPRQTTPFLVLQFFIFPMAIVAVCVTVFVVFGLISGDSRGARDYLSDVRSGSANRRWQAAFELSKVLQAKKDPALADPRFVMELADAYEASANDDPRVRRYLALALGRLGDARAVPALRKGLGDSAAPRDSEALLFSIWALGAIGSPEAVPDLVSLTAHDDAGVRKTAVHALGAFQGNEPQEALRQALKDGTEDVRWNAALALGRRGDAAAGPVLAQMLDRTYLETVSGLSVEQREDVILEAARSASTAPDASLAPRLEKLRDGDANLKVRDAARLALERRDEPK